MSKTFGFLIVFLLLTSVIVSAQVVCVSGWSNGGYSGDPANPKYGTHDWIAQHALDWLPTNEKQFIQDHLASYLYGTELPDNKSLPNGGIGDTTKHHIYYFANYSLQEDDAAVRAQEEYANASAFFGVGDLVNASKMLGVMGHYIADVASFGHVMGNHTDWGPEDDYHHSDYERRVNESTGSYDAEFNTYLQFDGSLSVVSAYDAALTMARNTTFGDNGSYTCVWMNQSYDWSSDAFRNRTGELLNLAVNAVTDVLHTFYLQVVVPEYPTNLILPTLLVIVTLIVLYQTFNARKKSVGKQRRHFN